MPIVSKNLAGLLFLVGLVLILALKLIFFQPFLSALIMIIGLLLAIIFLRQPLWGTVLFLIIRPAIDQLSENISLSLGENLTVNASALLGAMILLLGTIYFIKNRHHLKEIPLKFFWALYLLVAIVSLFFSLDLVQSAYELIRVLSIAIIFFLAFDLAWQQKKTTLLQAVLLSATVPFLVALWQLFSGSGLGGTTGIESRLFGTFSHPNAFASFALAVFAVSYYYLMSEVFQFASGQKKYGVFLIFLLSLLIILGTFSRGAWLALLIIALVLSLYRSPKIILAGIGIGLVLFFTSQTVRDRIEDVYNPPADSSIRWRFQQWNKASDAFIQRPWTGWGAGTEVLVHEREQGFYAGNPYTHNDILRAALETGLPGTVAYFLLISIAIFSLFRAFQKAKKTSQKDLALIVFALFLATFIFSMTSNIFRGTATQWTLWTLVAVTLATNKLSNSPSYKEETKKN